MRVLVTGATGFIGKDLCESLLQNGHQIHYLTTAKHKIESEQNYQGFLWDPAKKEVDFNAFKGVEAIINLAGHTINCSWNSTNKAWILNSRIDSSDTLFYALKRGEHEVKYIFNASAIGIYKSSEYKLYEETSIDFGTDFLAEVCKQWEVANQRFQTLGIETAIGRIGLALSKDAGVLYELNKVVSMGVGACLGNGKQWMSWIHKEDLVRAILFLVEKQKSGVYNLVAPNPLRQKDFLEVLAQSRNRKIWLPAIPSFFIKIILGERAALALSSQQVNVKKLLRSGYNFRFTDLKSVLDAIYTT